MTKVADEAQGRELLRAMSTTLAHKIAVCAAHLLLKDGAVVLDAGCADGLATAWLAQSNPRIHVIGLDYDGGFIAKAHERFAHLPNLEFIEADLRDFDLGGRQLDAVLNLSILHEPYSYTGYRAQTVKEILAAELRNLSPGGIIINRDFVLPPEPEKPVYMALRDDGRHGTTPDDMSLPDLLRLYSQEAMAYDHGDAEGHIKGFFFEERTAGMDRAALGLDGGWRIFYLPHGFAWEFIWRKEYRSRFYPEANEKYGYWNALQHRREAEQLGCRVLFSAPYENPWILERWYAPTVKLFDADLAALPLPPSNFVCVMQKSASSSSFFLREHRQASSAPSFLQLAYFENTSNGERYDMVKRPGEDVIDVFPWHLSPAGDVVIFSKCDYPRPIANTQPRRMTANLDGKIWSGHMIEPLAAAPRGDWQHAVQEVLHERAGFPPGSIGAIEPALTYYTAPAELNERVQSVYVGIQGPSDRDRPSSAHFSGFSHDGSIRSHEALRLLPAIQVGMLAEARLELNLYNLLRRLRKPVGAWIGGSIQPGEFPVENPRRIEEVLAAARDYQVFREVSDGSGWIDIVRSEFHERELRDGRERVTARRELEFVVPNPASSRDVSTNGATLLPVVKDNKTGKYFIGLQRLSEQQSQFPAVQFREGHSGHVTLAGLRLPSSITTAQAVPGWIARQTGVREAAVKKLGESYFPSLGVLPNRVFPYVVTEPSQYWQERCEFFALQDVFDHVEALRDANTMIAVFRLVHVLGEWPAFPGAQAPQRKTPP
jgi:SAM-dependent methyltransferase